MTPKERAILALTLKQPDEVPTFELEFQLTEEVFGEEYYKGESWEGKTEKERERLAEANAALYIKVAEKYHHSIIMETSAPTSEDIILTANKIREASGDNYLIICHGDATYAIPSGDKMLEFVYNLSDHKDEMKENAQRMVNEALERGKKLIDNGIDGFALCADYCFNSGPFISPAMFREFITPYLEQLIQGYRRMGAYVIKHTDGNIMPIIDQIVDCGPHALHSLDPMAGVDIAEVKRMYGKRVCLIGNVNCALMQTGTREEILDSCRYAMENGKPGGGYIFSTSNVVFKGMPLESYEIMMDYYERNKKY
ncbi:MAG: hypothetical protein GXO71_00930 [Caldiserica bacterium]|nr:hypothetical protein [Caldisericota bacterium]